ncbi:LXG domain-containing protein [Streptococcus equinus]|uniref:LXG domain-containing protein n=1 Tax=Streptococcus equinus TaxID=1335 RepID=UPI00215AFCD0|nr:LXG domain-containing protein [Streptococcus equinus]UVF02988.1 LXG domain-containing protein [Streptococcus equinus]
MGFHVDLEELHKAANKLNQEASRIETQLTDAKNSVNKIITSEALQGKTGQAIYQQLNNVDAAVLVGLADTSKVLASEFSSLLSSFHSSIGETSNSAVLDEDYLNQLKDNLNNFKNQHGAQEENISSIYASISDLISLSGPQSNYDADSDTASQLLSTTIDKVTSFDSSGTAPTSADLLAAIDTEVNQVSQTTDLPYTDSQYLSFISDVNFAKSIKSVDKQLTEQEKLAKEQAEQKARKEWAKQHPVVAWLQSQADLDANFFEGARKTLEKQNWDFFGGQLDKSVALTALGFVDGVCETIDQLALGAAQLGQLAFEGIEWGGNTLFKQKTPQWVKADVTGAWNNVMAASEFGTRLLALDADAWNAVAKTGEKVGSDLASAIKTGDDYKIGGYLFDVATLVGPAAVGKLKYVDEASNLTKLAKTSEVASGVGKVEDGVKVGNALSFEKLMSAEDAQKYAQWNKYAEAGIEPEGRVKLLEISEKAPKVKYQEGISSDDILDLPKKERPNPEEVYKPSYIEAHKQQFSNGASRFQVFEPSTSYQDGIIGGEDGNSFWLTQEHADVIQEVANGDKRRYEVILGFDNGYLGNHSLYRLDASAETVAKKGILIPSGNEDGANSWWRPGARTYPGDIPEGVMKNISIKEGDITWNIVN